MQSANENFRPVPLIVDCDPGLANDDAMTILMALAEPGVHVLGVTLVAGNYSLSHEIAVALRLREALELDLPICAGFARPLVHERDAYADAVWGGWGTAVDEGAPLPGLDDRHAVEFIIEATEEHPGAVLLALGPMTNIAAALSREPHLADRLRGVVAMGGAIAGLPRGSGNLTPTAEFNVWVDAEAAHAVFRSGVEVTLVPLNACRSVPFPMHLVSELEAAGGPLAELLLPTLGPVVRGERGTYELATLGEYGICDQLALLALVSPELFRFRDLQVEVTTERGPYYGTTLAYELGDHRAAVEAGDRGGWDGLVQPRTPPGLPAPVRPVRVAYEVDAGAAAERVVSALVSADAAPQRRRQR